MKNILVIQNKRIGDVLIASLIATNLKKVFPDAVIDYMVYDYTTGVIENNPAIHEIIAVNEKELKNFSVLLRTALHMRRKSYDILIDPYGKFQSRILSLFSGAAIRLGFKKRNKTPLLPYYTHQVPYLESSDLPCGKSIHDRVNLVSSFFNISDPTYVPMIHLSPHEQAYDKLTSYDKPVIMVGILGSTPQKSMPYDYITALIDFVTKQYDVYILFNYAPHQKADAEHIYNSCQHKSQIIFDVYENDIRGFIKLMNQCTLLIANEGGTVHIAKALDKPTFTIFSPYVLKEHWASFEDGQQHTSIHVLDSNPELFSKDREHRKKIEEDPSYIYRQLTPELIIPKLQTFLEHHLN